MELERRVNEEPGGVARRERWLPALESSEKPVEKTFPNSDQSMNLLFLNVYFSV